MPSRRHGRPQRTLPPAPNLVHMPPPTGLPLLAPASTHPLQPPPPLRNPWVSTPDSDHGTSSSASVPRPQPSTRRPSLGQSSVVSSSGPPSRGLAAPGCCSPGAQLICYYCLRAALLASLLGGTALAVAGVALRRHGRDELGVLLYIGALAGLVSALLLAVQHRARHHATRPRPRVVTASTRRGSMRLEEAVPLQDMGPMIALQPQQQQLQQQPPGNTTLQHGWATTHTFGPFSRSDAETAVGTRSSGRALLPPPPASHDNTAPASLSGHLWSRLGRGRSLQQQSPAPELVMQIL